ncbi:MAG: YkvA family protein [Myxococcota bacterium]
MDVNSTPERYEQAALGNQHMTTIDQRGFYKILRRRVETWLARTPSAQRWSQYVLLAPDFFHLMCKLSIDAEVPLTDRAKLAVAIAYFVSPIDLLPPSRARPSGFS